MSGNTVRILFTNTYLSNFTEVFRHLDHNFPTLSWILSAMGGVFQSLFQSLMIPLMFTKIGAKFVRFQMIGFFVACTILVKLSLLPVFELLIWGVIFLGNKIEKPKAELLTKHFSYKYYTSICVFYLIYHSPIIGTGLKDMEDTYFSDYNSPIKRSLYRFGFDAPNVFNTKDLNIGTRYICIYDDKDNLLPYLAEDGSRLSLHFSDQMYYGGSSPINRKIYDNPINSEEDLKEVNYFSRKILKYFYWKDEITKFKLVVYKNNSANLDHSFTKYKSEVEFIEYINWPPSKDSNIMMEN